MASHLAQKLRRLIYVRMFPKRGERHVSVKGASLWWDPRVTQLGELILTGDLVVDFDVCIRPEGRIRNHGTKLRLRPDALGRLYAHHEEIATMDTTRRLL